MKCEKCGNMEAGFHYKSIINGEVTEKHLCTECAHAEGFGDTLSWRPRGIFDEFFGAGGLLGEPSMRGMIPGFGYPPGYMTGFMVPVLASPRQVEVTVGESSEEKIPAIAGDEYQAKRELYALKHQLRQAVYAEEFEKAAQLRDKIRSMENNA